MISLVIVACLLVSPVHQGLAIYGGFEQIPPRNFEVLLNLLGKGVGAEEILRTIRKTVRLVNGTGYAGRLEIQNNGAWGTVCEDGFGREEVLVACKMLLLSSDISVIAKSSLFGAGSDEKQILLDDLECNGTEMSLWECKHSGLYNHNCSHSKDVGIICDFNASQLRLSGKRRINKKMGRVEIEVGGVWSGVCGSFSNSSARVICTQLGFPSKEAMTTVVSPFGPGESTGFLEVNLNCTGNEMHIEDCLRGPLVYSAHCNTEELGVICSNNTTSLYVVVASPTEHPFMKGIRISLKCENTQSDKPVANYSWPDTAGGTSFGQNLIFKKVKREHHEKLVRCSGSYGDNNKQLIYSDTTTLEVYYEPVIEIISRSSNCIYEEYNYKWCLVTRGDNVTFTCNASSNPPPAVFKWLGRSGGPTNSLTITATENASDDGPYICYVETTSDARDPRLPLVSLYQLTIIVQYPPTILSYVLNAVDNDTVTVAENSNINMSCVATGMFTPQMRLMGSNRQELTRRPQGHLLSYEKRKELSFFVCKVQCEDSGDYRCEVDNELGHDSKTVKLLVPCAPRSKISNIHPQNVDFRNNKVNFSVEIIAYPTPHLANITFHRSTIKSWVDKPVESKEINAACAANTFNPALVVCNISVINAGAGIYQAVFSNDFGNLFVDFVALSNSKHILYGMQQCYTQLTQCFKIQRNHIS